MNRLATLGSLLLLNACDVSHETTVTRAEPYSENLPGAEGAPDVFEVDLSADDARPREIGQCASRLIDPEDQVRLRISESRITSRRHGDTLTYRGYGDYFVEPEGSYGIRGGERLRIDCARNATVGLVAG